MSDMRDLLPVLLLEIADVIGIDAALKLSAEWPGIRLHVPKIAHVDHALTIAIGLPATRALCKVYGGNDLVIPMASRAAQARLNEKILEELDAGELSAPEIARKYGVHQFKIYRLAGASRKADQQSLF